MPDRDHDLVLYGATGFTGRLVAEHLRDHAPEGLRWAIAGRRRGGLEEVAEELGLGSAVGVVVADSTDDSSVRAMAEGARVVCTTVGPYARYGSPLVAACAEAGTDYCDLTGELPWIRRMIDAHADTAERTGARILHCCGFDSIPSDLGVLFAQRELHARHGVHATRVSCRVKALRGGASGGTIASGIDQLGQAITDPEVRRVLADPYSLNPDGVRGPAVSAHAVPFRDEVTGRWAGPFPMAAINARVVRRSHALMGQPWGADFTYDEAMLTSEGPVGAVVAGGIAAGVAGGVALGALVAATPAGRRLLGRVLPEPGTGPSAGARRNGFFDFRVRALHPTDPALSVTAKVLGDRDPGYGSTSRMLGETALALAAGEATVGGGSWTPASALGDALLRRLPASAGVTFSVVEPG